MNFTAAGVLALSFAGMVDTLYLSLSRDSGPVPCHITEGCGDVLNSVYSEIAGIPISWFGLAFYLVAFGLAVFEIFGGYNILRILFWPAAAALATSLALTGIQVFVIQAYCEYCLTSAGLATGIFFLTLASCRRRRSQGTFAGGEKA
jgi:uncharacterized membrane protein